MEGVGNISVNRTALQATQKSLAGMKDSDRAYVKHNGQDSVLLIRSRGKSPMSRAWEAVRFGAKHPMMAWRGPAKGEDLVNVLKTTVKNVGDQSRESAGQYLSVQLSNRGTNMSARDAAEMAKGLMDRLEGEQKSAEKDQADTAERKRNITAAHRDILDENGGLKKGLIASDIMKTNGGARILYEGAKLVPAPEYVEFLNDMNKLQALLDDPDTTSETKQAAARYMADHYCADGAESELNINNREDRLAVVEAAKALDEGVTDERIGDLKAALDNVVVGADKMMEQAMERLGKEPGIIDRLIDQFSQNPGGEENFEKPLLVYEGKDMNGDKVPAPSLAMKFPTPDEYMKAFNQLPPKSKPGEEMLQRLLDKPKAAVNSFLVGLAKSVGMAQMNRETFLRPNNALDATATGYFDGKLGFTKALHRELREVAGNAPDLEGLTPSLSMATALIKNLGRAAQLFPREARELIRDIGRTFEGPEFEAKFGPGLSGTAIQNLSILRAVNPSLMPEPDPDTGKTTQEDFDKTLVYASRHLQNLASTIVENPDLTDEQIVSLVKGGAGIKSHRSDPVTPEQIDKFITADLVKDIRAFFTAVSTPAVSNSNSNT